MTEVRKFRWPANVEGDIPEDSGFDYVVETKQTFPVTEGVREDIDPAAAEFLKLIGLYPTLDTLVSWANNPEDALYEVTA